ALADSAADPLGHLAEISELRSEFDGVANSSAGAESTDGAMRLIRHFEEYRARTLDEIERVAAFAHGLHHGIALAFAPEVDAGVRDLSALARVAQFVTSGATILKPLQAAAARTRASARRERKEEKRYGD
ncbi:MAG TPA: hypothetical protein VEU51_15330, partial [Candidatus Acidoferrales bacterium]|nr:hypothetical protein [Candidatus Acidoferrales bacterium]